jgi:transcriptional regulator with XRE-family HTH domain
MNKREAIQLFGGTQRKLASALGVTESAISQWPHELTSRQCDLVIGAAYRLGRLPCEPASPDSSEKVDQAAA